MKEPPSVVLALVETIESVVMTRVVPEVKNNTIHGKTSGMLEDVMTVVAAADLGEADASSTAQRAAQDAVGVAWKAASEDKKLTLRILYLEAAPGQVTRQATDDGAKEERARREKIEKGIVDQMARSMSGLQVSEEK